MRRGAAEQSAADPDFGQTTDVGELTLGRIFVSGTSGKVFVDEGAVFKAIGHCAEEVQVRGLHQPSSTPIFQLN